MRGRCSIFLDAVLALFVALCLVVVVKWIGGL